MTAERQEPAYGPNEGVPVRESPGAVNGGVHPRPAPPFAVGDLVRRGRGVVVYRVTAVVETPLGSFRVWIERLDGEPVRGGRVFNSARLRHASP